MTPRLPGLRRAACVAAAIAFASAASAQPPPDVLRIVVIEGEGAVNVIQRRTAVAPVVEVRDRNNLPVAGAVVTFSVPSGGATFGGGAQMLTVTTNAAGRAVAAGLTPAAGGAVNITASAAFQGQTVVATITQTNVLTAAEAAALGGATPAGGGSAAGTGGAGGAAGGGSGGGVSGTTLGIAGGAAAAAGVLVAARQEDPPAPEPPRDTSTSYTGQYAGTAVVEFGGACRNIWTTSGTVTVTIVRNGHTLISGTASVRETRRLAGTSCRDTVDNGSFLLSPLPVTLAGLPSVEFTAGTQSTYDTGRVAGTEDYTWTFVGTLNGNEIAGTLVSRTVNNLASPNPAPAIGAGATTYTITLR